MRFHWVHPPCVLVVLYVLLLLKVLIFMNNSCVKNLHIRLTNAPGYTFVIRFLLNVAQISMIFTDLILVTNQLKLINVIYILCRQTLYFTTVLVRCCLDIWKPQRTYISWPELPLIRGYSLMPNLDQNCCYC